MNSKWIKTDSGYLTNTTYPNWQIDVDNLTAIKYDTGGEVCRVLHAASLQRLKKYIQVTTWQEKKGVLRIR